MKIPDHLITDSDWTNRKWGRFMLAISLIGLGVMFFPWTQNIEAQGKVTSLLPNERPQEIHALIAGKIHKWYVKEGDFVQKGDTLVQLTEIKSDYLSPELLDQTEKQIQAKENSVLSYNSKVDAINKQITQIESTLEIAKKRYQNKIEQEQFKLSSELADYEAAKTNYRIAKQQFERDSSLAIQRIKSPVDVENRKAKLQESQSKLAVAQAKISAVKTAIETAKLELQSLSVEYGEKLSKAESDRYSAVSAEMEAESDVAKLRNSYSNYIIRNGFYIITAPQDGIITETISQGLGQVVKEGGAICNISPQNSDKVIEFNLQPNDVPLVEVGTQVQCVFDGWPTMVFSGWPEATFGTFPGTVYAMNTAPESDGSYRIFVKPNAQKKWPSRLNLGVGSRGYMLLKRVPIWYEIWRLLSGFPVDYYHPNDAKKDNYDKK